MDGSRSSVDRQNADAALLALVDGLPAMVAYWNAEQRCKFANRAYLEWFGVAPEELIGQHIQHLLGPNLYALNRPHIEAALRGEEQLFEREIPAPGGGPPRFSQARYIPDVADGVVRGFVAHVVDISDRRRAELALAHRERELREAQRLASVGSWEWDARKNVSSWSDEQFRIFGRNPQLGAPKLEDLGAIYTADELADLKRHVDRALATGQPYEIERAVTRPDGSKVWVHSRAEVVREGRGAIVGVRGTTQDITERKRLEETVLSLQRMESIGRLAGGIAHDFNNLLTVIHTELAFAIDSLNGSAPHVVEALRDAQDAATRSAELTRHLLTFARKQVASPSVIALNDAAARAIAMMRRMLGPSIDLEWAPSTTSWHVEIDPTQLQQILANLLANARDAVEGSGKVTLATENVIVGERTAADDPPLEPGEYVRLTCSDTGHGMSPEVRARAFEPFYTTKPTGRGTGLGLSIVYGIVSQCGGHIALRSEPGQGSTVDIWLRRHAPPSASSEPTPRRDRGGTERLLVVEDEEIVLKVTSKLLTRFGYAVTSSSDPVAALARFEAAPDDFDLLLTDIVMPHLNGRDLARAVKAIRPAIPVVYMSGFTAEHLSSGEDADIPLLQKPFTVQDLASTIRRALDARASEARSCAGVTR